MKRYKQLVFWGLLVSMGIVASCSNPVKDEQADIEQAYQDSLAQASIDEEIIETYLEDNGYTNVSSTEDGVRYGVVSVGDGVFAEINQIVSLDYIGKLTNGEIFDTSIKEVAIYEDSLAWVADGVDIAAAMAETGFDIETTLDSLQYYDGSVSGIYSSLKSYRPMTYNYIASGAGIPSGAIKGYREAVKYLTPEIGTGGEGMTIFPSALGYGTAELTNIPANSVLIFEFYVDNIRP
ncbi:hypothetical protein BFP72_00890 [Reichenbachiella sp. 5M10]|uniref:FKBP-type peptidyl-prolyl cis-trans isomerase n=1 Tax=Reichenbachiella sp. 5M10 TaxID=1889772 RepID=UPI000C14C445|nr:FKBP-type peptidyl-prolyl cis-trans isomerase [Reichenbachiella sp. 5M10]PIB34083.1 hypothetical protein BFP72_00890 [Reichenbachiella sp. 5M10]